jgi:hypothetical protein
MTDLITEWRRLKALVLDSVSSPITRRVSNLGLDEFFAWYGQEPRPGFTKATVSAWRVALEARGLGGVSINVRITAVRKLAVEAADNGLLAPELANGITRVKGVASKGVRLGNWLSVKQAQALLEYPRRDHHQRAPRPRDPGRSPGLRAPAVGGCGAYGRAHPAEGWPLVHCRSSREAWTRRHGADADLGEGGDRCVDCGRRDYRWSGIPSREPRGPSPGSSVEREGCLAVVTGLCGSGWCSRHRAARPEKLCRIPDYAESISST